MEHCCTWIENNPIMAGQLQGPSWAEDICSALAALYQFACCQGDRRHENLHWFTKVMDHNWTVKDAITRVLRKKVGNPSSHP